MRLATAPAAGPWAPCWAIRFPPLRSPGRPSTALTSPQAACDLGAPGGGPNRSASTMAVSAARGYLPMLCGSASQRPVIHRTHPPPPETVMNPAASGITSTSAGLCAANFVEVDAHYESPASETGACKPVQATTQWESAR